MSNKANAGYLWTVTIVLFVLGIFLIHRNILLVAPLKANSAPMYFPRVSGYCVSNHTYIPCEYPRGRMIAFLLRGSQTSQDVRYWNSITPALSKAGFVVVGICDGQECADGVLKANPLFAVLSYGEVALLNTIDQIFSPHYDVVVTDAGAKIIKKMQHPKIASDLVIDPFIRFKGIFR